ncbi:TonB-dependent hemoglobin/transferrin/lactoferrin family receptor [Aeromonas diversa]|nr:TonB-dependent hemoglobin/transferrin/lactoferrin family receptor [Aeromonas diversa]
MKPHLMAWSALFCCSTLAANSPQQRDETIIVTGQRVKQKLSELPGSLTVITDEEIERQVASELTHLFRSTPGVSVTGSAGRPQNISIRGIGGNRILMIKDGIRVSDGFGADNLNDKVGRFTFDLDDIKQIEIAKGAGASLHGSDAIGGTINITTKQPEDYLQGQDAYLAGKGLHSGDSDKNKLGLTGATRLLGGEHLLRLSGWRGHESANFEQSRIPAELDGMSLSAASRFALGDSDTLRIEYDHFADNGSRDQGPRTLTQSDGNWDVIAYRERGEQRSNSGKLSWERRDLGPLDSLTWSLYGSDARNLANQRQLLRNDALSGYPRYRSQQTLARFDEERLGSELELQSSHRQGALRHRLSYGLELEQAEHRRPVEERSFENGVASAAARAPFSQATTQRVGLWLSDVMNWGDWQLTPSLRFDHQSLQAKSSLFPGNESSNLSPSLMGGYRFDETWRTWLSYAKGFKAPSYDHVYGSIPHYFALPPFEIVPNTKLKAETSHALEWGVNGQGERWSLTPTLFYNRYYNQIDWRQFGLRLDDGVYLRQYRNLANTESWGAELAASLWLSEQWELSSSLAWMDGRDSQGQPLRTLSPLEGSSTLRWQGSELGLSLIANYAAAMSQVPRCEDQRSGYRGACLGTPGWLSLDLGLDWQASDALKINATVGNLLDARYIRYQDVAGQAPGSNTSLYTQSGRYLSASLNYRFVGL